MSDKPRCKGTTTKGEQCKLAAQEGSDFCHIHRVLNELPEEDRNKIAAFLEDNWKPLVAYFAGAFGEAVISDLYSQLKTLADIQRQNQVQAQEEETFDIKYLKMLAKADSLRGVDLTGIKLENANLRWIHLEGAILEDADLHGANLAWGHLQGANLLRATLQGAFLEGVDLSGASLGEATLQRANLGGAILRGANLRGVNLEEARLAGADLRGAYLGSRLKGVNQQGANLQRADLENARLGGAIMQGTRLEGATLPDGSRWLEGRDISHFTDPNSDWNRKLLTPVSFP